MNDEVFLNTVYAIALASEKDEFDEGAIILAEQLERAKIRLITTRAIQLENGKRIIQIAIPRCSRATTGFSRN